MYRIDTTDTEQKWRFTCPAPGRHRDWRVVDGLFECRSCGETYRALIDRATGERVPRGQIEIVGPHADHQGRFGSPTVDR